jgi:diphthamide biosynthesis methyltransferase
VLGNVGKEDELIIYSKVSNLLKLSGRFKEKVISLIFPSKPNFAEEESLKRYFISNI